MNQPSGSRRTGPLLPALRCRLPLSGPGGAGHPIRCMLAAIMAQGSVEQGSHRGRVHLSIYPIIEVQFYCPWPYSYIYSMEAVLPFMVDHE